MKNKKTIVHTLIIGLALIIQLMHPFSAYADGEITPVPTDATEVTVTPAPTDTLEVTATPVPTDVLPSETPTPDPALLTTAAATSPEADPVETDTPTPQPPTVESTVSTPDPIETTDPADASDVEEPTVLEIVHEVPGETEVVVLDENGQPLALASQDAADIIANGDPMWCPAGATTVTSACVSATTVTALLPLLASIDTDGVIYFYTPTTYTTNDVTFDGSTNLNIDQLADNNLTLQGGWNGVTTVGSTITYSGNSVFSVPIQILNWNKSVTINNITVDGAVGSGLVVKNNGNVNITKSSFINNQYGGASNYPWGDGADIFTTGDVIITNSHFDGNSWDDLYGYANSYQISDSTFESNGTGAGLNVSVKNEVKFTNTTFGNPNIDLSIYCQNSGLYLGANFPDAPTTTLDGIGINTNCEFYAVTGTPPPVVILTPPPTKKTPSPGDGYFVPPSGSQVNFSLNCDNQSSFRVNLPNGDKVEIVCPVRGQATITRLDNTIIPELPMGFTYASAFQLDVSKLKEPLVMDNGDYETEPVDVITEGGFVKISFVSPATQVEKSYTILFWDNATNQWIPLNDFAYGRSFPLFPNSPEDKRMIQSGVFFNSSAVPSRVEVSTNFPGIFVLAQR